MLGYADYVFTAVFAFEIGLKVTGSTAVCLRGLLLHVTHSKAAWSAFDDFSFLSSVIKLTLFSFLNQRIFFWDCSTCFCCFFLTFDAWRSYFGFMIVVGNCFALFYMSSEICQLVTDTSLCELSSTLPDIKVRGKAFILWRECIASHFFD